MVFHTVYIVRGARRARAKPVVASFPCLNGRVTDTRSDRSSDSIHWKWQQNTVTDDTIGQWKHCSLWWTRVDGDLMNWKIIILLYVVFLVNLLYMWLTLAVLQCRFTTKVSTEFFFWIEFILSSEEWVVQRLMKTYRGTPLTKQYR